MYAFHRGWPAAPFLLLLGLAASVGVATTPKKLTGRIIFEDCSASGSLPCPNGIWSVNADGTDPKALTTDGHDPAWSPDARHIFYIHDTFWPTNLPLLHVRLPKRWRFPLELYEMDSDGGDQHLLRRFDGHINQVVCSPDGKYLAGIYSPASRHVTGIFVMPTTGAIEPRLLFLGSSWPAWSPNGKELVFSQPIPGGDRLLGDRALAVGVADGSREMQLTDPKRQIASGWIRVALSPAWSPGGKEIAFEGKVQGTGMSPLYFANNGQIFVIKPNGSDLRQLTADPSLDGGFLTWSPNGKWIAFDAEKTQARPAPLLGSTTTSQIFLIRPDGRGLRQLTDNTNWNCYHPSWSPDGSEIAFSCSAVGPACNPGNPGPRPPSGTRMNCVQRLFLMRTDDPEAKPIQITDFDGANPSFSPVP
jgi:Tol biopolymer transport system component